MNRVLAVISYFVRPYPLIKRGLICFFVLFFFLASRNLASAPSNNNLLEQTSIGSLTADAMRDATGVDIALIPGSSIQEEASLLAKKYDSLLYYPDDKIFVFTLTGTQIKNVLERSVNLYPRPFAGFLQVSGLTFSYQPSLEAGKRVTEVYVEGKPLNPDRKYKVAVSSYLEKGFLGYTIFPEAGNSVNTEITLADALKKYLPKINLPKYNPNRRIIVIK